jgi:hypothetical protein
MNKTPLDQKLIQRVTAGVKYAVTGVAPNGFFTPQQPTQPMAQETADGRQFDYRAGINVAFQPKVTEGSGISFQQLRSMADSLDILRLVIETRKDQMSSLGWEIVPKKGKKVDEAELDRIQSLMQQPTPEHDWDEWMRMLLEDLFVLDAVAIYPRKTRGGGLYSLDLIDGATIKRVIDDGGRTPIAPDPAYQQILKGIPAVDYTAEELIYRMRNPRTNRIYGYSPVEQIIMTVNIALRRQLTQLQYYTEGNIPEALASVPEGWSAGKVAEFQMYFDSLLVGNMSAKSRLKFVPLDVSKIKETKDATMKDTFDEWLARIVCYAFSVPPTPFVRDSNKSTADTAKDSALQEGLYPIMNWMKRIVDGIIAVRLGNKNVEFMWRQDEAIDPLQQAQIDKIYVDSKIRSAEAIHAERGWGDAVKPTVETPDNETKTDEAIPQAIQEQADKQTQGEAP